MLTISDNVCTDALLDLVGLESVNATAARLGLGGTVVGSNLRELIDSLARDTGFAAQRRCSPLLRPEPRRAT